MPVVAKQGDIELYAFVILSLAGLKCVGVQEACGHLRRDGVAIFVTIYLTSIVAGVGAIGNFAHKFRDTVGMFY